MKISIKRSKSVAATLSIAAVTIIAVMLGAFAIGIAQFNYGLIEQKAVSQIRQQSQLVKAMLTNFDSALRDQAERLLKTLSSQFPNTYSLRADEQVDVKGRETPAIYNGDQRLNLDTAALEAFTQSSDAAATIFVRSGDDFIRVATTLANEKGERALGTLLSPDHPATAKLLADERYVGLAHLFGRDYITAYKPIQDSRNRVIGALFVGLDISKELAGMKKEVLNIKVGETGYFFALDARPGKNLGNLVIHPTKEGTSILAAKDADGHEFIKEMLEKKEGVIHYPWINKEAGETAPRSKVVAYEYLPEWNWVIAGGAYQDELSRDSVLLRNITFAVAFAVVIILGFALFWLSKRLIGRPLNEAATIFEKIGAGTYNNAINMDRADEIGTLFRSLARMQKNLDERTKADARVASEAFRIRRALDKASTNMMVADVDGVIVYMNEAVLQMMRAAEADMRKDLPNFNADRLIGSSFDDFHKNPAHQRHMVAAMQNTHRTEVKVGGRTFRLVANPVIDEEGKRLGSVVEWTDRTSEVETENELATLLQSAVKGDFTRRLPLEGKTGFFRDLSEGMNQLVEIVSKGLSDIARVLEAIAQGDLTKRIDADYEGTFGQLKDDTNLTVARLKEVVANIKESTDTINTASGEIASGNADLSARTESQAGSLEETASAMEQLNATVRQNAQNAQQANQLAKTSNEMATHGGTIVSQVVATMNSIQESSRKIADIITVIDGIAFQTNILALNAAVEAARAGEQGKGFAVVAGEVRNLAQRSAQAAKEIKALIAESVSEVDGGARLVQEAGETMTGIVGSFQDVTTLVMEIAAASREQSTGIEQVSQAVTQMDEVTQQNAALVEEAAAAAESLEDQARSLARAVAMFKLDEHSAPPKAAVTPRQTPALTNKKAASVAPLRKQPALQRAPMQAEDEWDEF